MKNKYFLIAVLIGLLALLQTTNAAVVASTTDSYVLTLADVTAPQGTVINGDGLSNWPGNTSLTWTVNMNKVGKYLVKANIASDWEGSLLKVSLGESTVTSKSCVTNGWGTWVSDCYVGVLEVRNTGEQVFTAQNINGNFNLRGFVIEPFDNIIELKPGSFVASGEGVTVLPDDINNWWNPAASFSCTIRVPKAGNYKLCGGVATDMSLSAELTFSVNNSSSTYEFRGAKNWSYFYLQSDKYLYIPTSGDNNLVVTRSGIAGLGAANLTTLYLTYVGDDTSDKPSMFLSGDFTNWDAGKLEMYKQTKASRLVVIPTVGDHSYKFIDDKGVATTEPNRTFTTSEANSLAFFESTYNVNDLTSIVGGKVYAFGNLGENNNNWSALQNEMTLNTTTNKFYYTAKLGGVGTEGNKTRFKAVYAKDAEIRWEAVMSTEKEIDITTPGVYVIETPLVKAYQDPQSVCTKVTDYAFYYGNNNKSAFVSSSADAALYTTTVDMSSSDLANTDFYVGIEHANAPSAIAGISAVKKLNTLSGISTSSVTLYTNSVADLSENLGVQVAVPYVAAVSKEAPTKSLYASEVSFSETFVDNAKWHSLSFPYDVISIEATLSGESSSRQLKPGVDFWLKTYSGKGVWQNATSLNADGTGISAGAYIMAVPTDLKNIAIKFTTKSGAVLTEGKIAKITPATDRAVLINNPYPYSVSASSLVDVGVIYKFDIANQRFDQITDYNVNPFESIMAWNVSAPNLIAPKSIALEPSLISTAIDKQTLNNGVTIAAIAKNLIINGSVEKVSVYDVTGKLIDTFDVNGEITKEYAPGIYIVRAGDKIEKVIIK